MFGAHVSLKDTVGNTAQTAQEAGMTAMQVFLGSPYHLARRTVTDVEAKYLKSQADKISVFTHLPYVHNFAGRANMKALAHSGNTEVDKYVDSCVASVQDELDKMSKCSCKGCVLHIGSIGSLKDRRAGCQSVAKSINKLNLTSTPLLLETMVGRGGVLGCNFHELAQVYHNVQDKDNVGFCLDTCHIFGEGMYDISKVDEVDKMFAEFDEILGANNLRLIHLNDSQEAFGSHKDRHEKIGQGLIWKQDDAALVQVLKQAKTRGVPVVLETSEDDFVNLQATLKKV